MKSNQLCKKIALFVSGIAVFALISANAADTESNVSNETNIVNKDAALTDAEALCPAGNPRRTRSQDCAIGQQGRQGNKGNFAGGRGGNKGCHGNFSKGRGGKGRSGHFAQGRGGRGGPQGRKGMGPGKGMGDGTGARDGSCLESVPVTAES